MSRNMYLDSDFCQTCSPSSSGTGGAFNCRGCRVDAAADVEVVELTADEGRAMFDEITRHELGVSAEVFLDAFDHGRFDGDPDDVPGLVSVLMALPLVR